MEFLAPIVLTVSEHAEGLELVGRLRSRYSRLRLDHRDAVVPGPLGAVVPDLHEVIARSKLSYDLRVRPVTAVVVFREAGVSPCPAQGSY